MDYFKSRKMLQFFLYLFVALLFPFKLLAFQQ
jgi:hypothetical protein